MNGTEKKTRVRVSRQVENRNKPQHLDGMTAKLFSTGMDVNTTAIRIKVLVHCEIRYNVITG